MRGLVPAIGAIALGVACVGGGLYAYSTYATWGGLGTGAPSRVVWCGRTYEPGASIFTLAQVRQEVEAGAHDGDLRQVARSPWGYAVMAAPMSRAQKASFRTNVCAMVVFVQLGSNSYRPYPLSGGP